MKFEHQLARLDRLTEIVGAEGCTCAGPGLEILELRPGEALPAVEAVTDRCCVHDCELPPGLRVAVHRPRQIGGVARGALIPDGRVVVSLPEPEVQI